MKIRGTTTSRKKEIVMKKTQGIKILAAVLALGLPAGFALAQDNAPQAKKMGGMSANHVNVLISGGGIVPKKWGTSSRGNPDPLYGFV